MSVKWLEVYKEVGGCKDYKGIEELFVKCGSEKGKVFGYVKSSIGNYCWGRDYREGRSSSMKGLREENKRLKEKLGV